MAVLIRSSIKYKILGNLPFFFPSVEGKKLFRSFFNNSLLIIIAVHRHPNMPFLKNIANSLFFFINSFNSALLLGDFNAYHLLCGFSRTNSADSLLADLTDSYNLFCLDPLQSFSIIPSGLLLLLISCFLPQIFHRSAMYSLSVTHRTMITSLFLSISTCKLNLFISSLINLPYTRAIVVCTPLINGICTENYWDLGKYSFNFCRRRIQYIHLLHFGKPRESLILQTLSQYQQTIYSWHCSSPGPPPAGGFRNVMRQLSLGLHT